MQVLVCGGRYFNDAGAAKGGCLMDAELRCYLALDALGLTMAPGETALDAVLRNLAVVDTMVRPYRYEQVDGMRRAYQTWLDLGGRGGNDLNTFQAGYTSARAALDSAAQQWRIKKCSG